MVAEWNARVESCLTRVDVSLTDFGCQRAYRYYKELNRMIDVLALDRLGDRAVNRNEAFVKILNSESNYDQSPKSALSAAE